MALEIDHAYRVEGQRILPDGTSQTYRETFERLLYKGFGGGHSIPVESNREWFHYPAVGEDLFFRPGNFDFEELPT